MSISKDLYEYFSKLGIPYEGDVEGVGYAYREFKYTKYPINKSKTEFFYVEDSINVLLVATLEKPVTTPAAIEAKVTADLNKFRIDLQNRLRDMQKALTNQAIAQTAALETKAKESESIRIARIATEAKLAQEAAIAKATEEKDKAAKIAEEKIKKAKAAEEKAKADRIAIECAEKLKRFVEEEFYKFAVPVSTRVERRYSQEIETFLENLKNQTSDKKIKVALDEVSKYIGTKYKQQTDYSLRTDSSEEALEYMDCTEFAARFLQIACELEKVPSFSTQILVPYAKNDKIYGGFMEFVEGSDATDFTDIRPGDIFLWRTKSSGHVGVVVSYDPANDYVNISEALTRGSEASLNGAKNELKNQVRHSTYTRTGKALAGHAGWKGYFRPIIKSNNLANEKNME